MKRLLAMICLTVISATLHGYTIETGDFDVTFDAIPQTIDEFVEMRNEYAVTPTGGATMFVIAMLVYSEDPDLGEQCMTAVLVNDGTMLYDDKSGYKGKSPNSSAQFYLKYITQYEGLAQSYLSGSGPDNGYTPDGPPYMVETSTNKYSVYGDDEIKIFVDCSGASTPRP